MARYIGPVCKLCRREGDEALPQGRALLHREVRGHAPPLSARPARPGAHQAQRVRPAPAREAEGAPHLRRARGAVPRLLPRGDPPEGPHRRGDARPARAPPRQRRLPHGLRRRAARRARQLVRHGHVLVNGKRVNIPSYLVRAGRQDRDSRDEPQDRASSQAALAAAENRPAPSWLEVDKDELHRHVQGAAGPRRAATSRCVASSYVVEYYSR